jgi:hypothetical protein
MNDIDSAIMSCQKCKLLNEFARSYRLHGDQWARMVRANPELRYSAGRAMRAIHENSKT